MPVGRLRCIWCAEYLRLQIVVLDVGRDSCLQYSTPRLTLTLISPCRVLAVWRRWQPLANRQNIQLCRPTLISSRSRWRPWVLWMSRPLLFCTIWVGEFRSWAGRTESLSFCFNAFQSPSSALMRCFCTTVFFCLTTTRISAAPNFIFFANFFLPREYAYRGLKFIYFLKMTSTIIITII